MFLPWSMRLFSSKYVRLLVVEILTPCVENIFSVPISIISQPQFHFASELVLLSCCSAQMRTVHLLVYWDWTQRSISISVQVPQQSTSKSILHSTTVFPEWPFYAKQNIDRIVSEEVAFALINFQYHHIVGEDIHDYLEEANSTAEILQTLHQAFPSGRLPFRLWFSCRRFI